MSTADPKVQVALRHLERGLEFQRTGSLNQAVSEYRSALSYDDNLLGAHLKLGEALCELKQFGPAAGALTRALALDPANVETLSAMAMLNYARGSDKLAAERWRQVIDRDPKNAAAHFNLGLALERQRELEGAREAYSKALALEPTMTRVIERLSSISQRVVDQKRDTQVFARAAGATANSFEPRAAQEIHQVVPEREEPASRSKSSGDSPFGVATRGGEPLSGGDADEEAAPVSAPLANAGGQKGGDVMFEPANVGGGE
jgi:tetratricopeptide (TPR) repeat protein